MKPYFLLLALLSGMAMGQARSPLGMRITARFAEGICDIRGDCWWHGRFCHGCGVSGTWPFVINHLEEYMLESIKQGDMLYVPAWPTLPVPEGLR
jgi:hypothetical protein